jgi:small subunit ribosomal protein S16
MAVKIRLQRHGKKGKPFYWIVAADERAKRDGRYLEKLGTYNPNLNPASISLNIDQSVKWIQFGAQPTDTARTILSNEGVLLKNHLINGFKKGALSEEQVEEKFQEWIAEKSSSIENKKSQLDKEEDNMNKIKNLQTVADAPQIEKKSIVTTQKRSRLSMQEQKIVDKIQEEDLRKELKAENKLGRTNPEYGYSFVPPSEWSKQAPDRRL